MAINKQAHAVLPGDLINFPDRGLLTVRRVVTQSRNGHQVTKITGPLGLSFETESVNIVEVF